MSKQLEVDEKVFVANSMSDVDELERQTALLLEKLHLKTKLSSGPKGKGAQAARGGKTEKSKSEKVDKKKEKLKEKAVMSSSLDMGKLTKTQNMFADTRTGSVEVLDNTTPDHSPRQDIDVRSERVKNISDEIFRLKHAQATEQKFRKMPFAVEHSRVVGARDTFAPLPTLSGDDVMEERDRLTRLEESARALRRTREEEVAARKNYLAQDRAALRVQSAFRGHIGRQRFALSKKLRELSDVGLWIEVRDTQTGESWFYNKQTGESTWVRPAELSDVLGNEANSTLKTLPAISSAKGVSQGKERYDVAGNKLPMSTTTSLPALDSTMVMRASAGQTAVTAGFATTKTIGFDGRSPDANMDTDEFIVQEKMVEAKAEKEVDRILGFDKLLPEHSLSAPDGTFKPQLRATILDALAVSRFSSVASVLGDPRWMDAEKNLFKEADELDRRVPIEIVPEANKHKIDHSRRPLISVVQLDQKKAKRPISVDPNSIRKIPDLTVKQIEHPGFGDSAVSAQAEEADVPTCLSVDETPTCFGCWSAGLMKQCAMHQQTEGAGRAKKSETLLLCRNWDLGVMRRRYRAEEIQEIFAREHASVRYDPKRKVFSTVFELKHPIYRNQSKLLNRFNERLFLMLKIRRWFMTFVEDVRAGHVRNSRQEEKAKKIRQRRNKRQHERCQQLSKRVRHRLPVPPTTGTSWPERIGEAQYLFRHPDQALGHEVELICVEPIPVPKHLYLPREYHLSVARPIPMPTPQYKESDVTSFLPANKFISDLAMSAWLERLCTGVTRDSVHSAESQVIGITPIPGLELLRRTKQPPPCTIKFATLGRKPTPGNMDVGSLPMELLVYQLISTYFPPQYGDFMVMDKSTVSPGVTPEEFISFLSVLTPPLRQDYISRPIEHPLNYRRAPTLSINSKITDEVRHLYGTNRPNQTGEQESHGFRTTAWSLHLESEVVTDPLAFIPNADVVTLNTPSANRARNTHADLSYPFCQPSSKDNTTLDFYHLLLTGALSAPHAQVFTALTIQEAGSFFKNCRMDLPMGRLVVSVYRSWAFTQKEKIQEFSTDDGIPYWYNRETGQSFWERPLYDEETISPLHGGVALDDEHNEQPTPFQKGEEGLTCRHTQGEWRKMMNNHHETVNEAEIRRKRTTAAARIAREKGTLPNVAEGYMEDYDGKWIPIPEEKEKEEPIVRPDVVTPQEGGNKSSSSGQKLEILVASPGPTGPSHAEHFNVEAGDSVASALTGFKNESLDTPRSHITMTSRRGSIVSLPPELGGLPAQEALPGVDTGIIASLSENISQMMNAMLTENATPQDMIQLGMGMGMVLLQSGAVQGLVDSKINPKSKKKEQQDTGAVFHLPPGGGGEPDDQSHQEDGVLEDHSLAVPGITSVPVGVEPIGAVKANLFYSSTRPLDHGEEKQQVVDTAKNLSQPLCAMDSCKKLEVVGKEKASLTPDDAPLKELTIAEPANAEEVAKKKIPLLVYPELSGLSTRGAPAPPEYNTHPAAGIGTAYLPKRMAEGHEHVEGANFLRKTVMPLPVGFFEAMVSKKVAKQEVDYLPKVPNLPQSRTVGRVKPRSVALDWLAVSFDPWSAGKSPLNTEFISALGSKAEKFLDKDPLKAATDFDELRNNVVKDAYVTVNDDEGNAKQRAEISKAQIIADEFHKLCSLCRHGKFAEVEQLLNRPDWNIPIDHQDPRGNTLLHVIAQNGNKRLLKLCLRRGAQLNIQNLNGQTPLHFAFGFGFKEVGEYLVSKGADDTIRNLDNLTCYEGLGARELSYL